MHTNFNYTVQLSRCTALCVVLKKKKKKKRIRYASRKIIVNISARGINTRIKGRLKSFLGEITIGDFSLGERMTVKDLGQKNLSKNLRRIPTNSQSFRENREEGEREDARQHPHLTIRTTDFETFVPSPCSRFNGRVPRIHFQVTNPTVVTVAELLHENKSSKPRGNETTTKSLGVSDGPGLIEKLCVNLR